jgi:hypothetical protein
LALLSFRHFNLIDSCMSGIARHLGMNKLS